MPGLETRKEEADRNFNTGFKFGLVVAIILCSILDGIAFMVFRNYQHFKATEEKPKHQTTLHYETMTAKSHVDVLLTKIGG